MATTDSAPGGELDAQPTGGASDDAVSLGAFAAAVFDVVEADDDPQRLIPLLERIAQSLDHFWNEARAYGLPGDFARLDEASRSVHRSLVSLREHAIERGGAALSDQDVELMDERRQATVQDLSAVAARRARAWRSIPMDELQSTWPEGAA